MSEHGREHELRDRPVEGAPGVGHHDVARRPAPGRAACRRPRQRRGSTPGRVQCGQTSRTAVEKKSQRSSTCAPARASARPSLPVTRSSIRLAQRLEVTAAARSTSAPSTTTTGVRHVTRTSDHSREPRDHLSDCQQSLASMGHRDRGQRRLAAGPVGIGVVVPYDLALDRELWRWVPERVSLHLTRTPYEDIPVGLGAGPRDRRPGDRRRGHPQRDHRRARRGRLRLHLRQLRHRARGRGRAARGDGRPPAPGAR